MSLLSMSLLSGCSSLPGMDFITNFFKQTKLKTIQIVAELHANQDSSTQIDIVFAYDASVKDLLPKTGPAWFGQKVALTNSLAQKIDVVSLQVPPGSLVEVPLPKRYASALYVASYANFLTADGQTVGDLTAYKNVKIWVATNSIQYQGVTP